MTSQHDEEKRVLEYFGDRVGRFLDLGAHSATNLSNTRCLADKGWKGVCVDASPHCSAALVKGYRDNPNVQVVQAYVGQAGLVQFYDALGDAISSAIPWFIEAWRKWGATNFTEMYVAGVTLADLLAKFPGPYDLIDIDTEGSSADLFYQCIELGCRPDMFIVEEDRQREKLVQTGAEYGYRHIDIPGNVILVK